MGIADKDYWLDDKGSVTTDENKAAVLLIRKGQEMPKETADKIGEKAKQPAENKSKAPAGNK